MDPLDPALAALSHPSPATWSAFDVPPLARLIQAQPAGDAADEAWKTVADQLGMSRGAGEAETRWRLRATDGGMFEEGQEQYAEVLDEDEIVGELPQDEDDEGEVGVQAGAGDGHADNAEAQLVAALFQHDVFRNLPSIGGADIPVHASECDTASPFRAFMLELPQLAQHAPTPNALPEPAPEGSATPTPSFEAASTPTLAPPASSTSLSAADYFAQPSHPHPAADHADPSNQAFLVRPSPLPALSDASSFSPSPAPPGNAEASTSRAFIPASPPSSSHSKPCPPNAAAKSTETKAALPDSAASAPVNKRQWQPSEDETLLTLVEQHGPHHWAQLAKLLGTGRTGPSCCARWCRLADVKDDGEGEEGEEERASGAAAYDVIKKGKRTKWQKWKPEEDADLLSLVRVHGANNWTLVASQLKTERSVDSCCARWIHYLAPKEADRLVDDEGNRIVLLKRNTNASNPRWTASDDTQLHSLRVSQPQASWAQLGEQMDPKRSAASVRARWLQHIAKGKPPGGGKVVPKASEGEGRRRKVKQGMVKAKTNEAEMERGKENEDDADVGEREGDASLLGEAGLRASSSTSPPFIASTSASPPAYHQPLSEPSNASTVSVSPQPLPTLDELAPPRPSSGASSPALPLPLQQSPPPPAPAPDHLTDFSFLIGATLPPLPPLSSQTDPHSTQPSVFAPVASSSSSSPSFSFHLPQLDEDVELANVQQQIMEALKASIEGEVQVQVPVEDVEVQSPAKKQVEKGKSAGRKRKKAAGVKDGAAPAKKRGKTTAKGRAAATAATTSSSTDGPIPVHPNGDLPVSPSDTLDPSLASLDVDLGASLPPLADPSTSSPTFDFSSFSHDGPDALDYPYPEELRQLLFATMPSAQDLERAGIESGTGGGGGGGHGEEGDLVIEERHAYKGVYGMD
ncbi:hypothetical protein JCM1840_005490 [Sporobolomyces johnsonii]